MKELLNLKNREIEQNIHQFNLQKRSLEDEIRNVLKDLESLKNRAIEMERAKSIEIEELRIRNSHQDVQFRERVT